MDIKDKAKWDIRFLNLAKHISTWSKDPSTQVGAVITDAHKIISIGYNGFAMGVGDYPDRYNDRNLKYEFVVHAEINACIFANRSLQGYTVYTYPIQPCSRCSSILINHGIKRVVSYDTDNPRFTESFGLSKIQFQEAGIILDLYKGII